MKTITFSRDALKTLRRIPPNTAATIRSKIGGYAENPASLANNVKPLRGFPNRYRLRVGDWRVIFREDGTVIAILRIAPRGSAYE